jgi:alpha-N-acetylglucosamine transferase
MNFSDGKNRQRVHSFHRTSVLKSIENVFNMPTFEAFPSKSKRFNMPNKVSHRQKQLEFLVFTASICRKVGDNRGSFV